MAVEHPEVAEVAVLVTAKQPSGMQVPLITSLETPEGFWSSLLTGTINQAMWSA